MANGEPAAAMDTRTLLANLAGLLGCSLTGASIVATRFVVEQTDPVTLAFLRYVVATLCLLPLTVWLMRGRSLPARDVALIAALGLLFFGLFPWMFSLALQYTTAARGALALATAPLMTLVLSSLVRAEPFGTVKVAAILTGIIGVAIALSSREQGLIAAGPDFWIGDLVMLGAAAITAVYAIAVKPLLVRHPPLLITALTMLAGMLGLAVPSAVIAIQSGPPSFDLPGVLAVLFLGIGGGALQFGLWVWAVSRLPPSHASLFLTLTPITAMVLGVVILGEPLTGPLLIGLVLVIAGLLAINWRPRAWQG